jgi:hypothetical protein
MKHREPLQGASRAHWRKLLWLALLCGAAYPAGRGYIVTVKLNNGQFLLTRYPLVEDPWEHPRLKELRRREKLDDIVAPGTTQFEKIVLLRRWAHSQWKSAARFYYPPWDAVEILDLARRRHNYGFCAQYAIVFLQAARSLGLHVRYVDLGHFLTSVWSDEYQRWVIMDPTNDIHFERGGIPMKGREISDALWVGKIDGILKVGSDWTRTPATLEDLEPYRKLSIVLESDQLSHPVLIEQNGVRRLLVHDDDYTHYPLEGRDRVGYGNKFLVWSPPDRPAIWPERFHSDDPDDFRDVYDQTIILVAAQDTSGGRVKLRLLAENAPDLDTFLGSYQGQPYAPISEEAVIDLSPGLNTFSVRVKTKGGWLGRESVIELYYKPDWLARIGV